MKTITKKTTRTLTTAAALAVCGLLGAEAADAAGLYRGPVTKDLVETSPGPKLTREVFSPSLPTPLPPPPAPQVYAALDGDGRLLVFGSNGADDVTVLIDDTGSNLVRVYHDDDLIGSFPSSPMTRIKINLKNGDDTYFIGLEPGSSHKFTKEIDVRLGGGDDSGFVDFRGTTSNAIVQGSLEISVIGGSGEDEAIAHFARKHGGKLVFLCNMQGHADQCSASMWGDITGGADVKFDLRGGGGADNLWSWNTYDQKDGAYSDIRITGDSTFDIKMAGGAGPDDLTPTYAGEVDGKLTLTVKGQSGGDESYGVVDLGGNSGGQVKAKTLGAAGSDDLRLDVFGTAPTLNAKINGGFGVDTCQSTPNVSKVSCP